MTTIYSGLAVGSIYVLVAVGYNLVYLASGLVNLAQAQFLMFGMFVAYATTVTRQMPVALAMLVGFVVCGLLALFEERVAVRPVLRNLSRDHRSTHGVLITTLGISVALEGLALLLWGADPKRVPFFGGDYTFTVAGGRIRNVEALLILVAVAVPLAIHFISRKTSVGLSMLATAEDAEAAQLRGIKVRLVVIGAFVLAGGIAGATALLVAPVTLAITDIGNLLAVKAFVALALGGFGSMPGALLGGFAVGLTESLTSRYIGPQYTDPVVFALLLVVLMVSPGGVLTRSQARHV